MEPSNPIDPEYVNLSTAIEQKDKEDKEENYKKLTKIIEREFNTELKFKQDYLEKIEIQICKVRKIMHALRYVLVTSYYNKKELLNNFEPQPSTSSSTTTCAFDPSSEVHPAVKKVLCNTDTNYLENCLTLARSARTKRRQKIQIKKEPHNKHKRPCLENKSLLIDKQPITDVVKEIQPDNSRQRIKLKHRFIIGNISKWTPSMEDNHLTHKWMVYVRGPKESPDLTHLIEKVVFYLHPSYKPHDVVHVLGPPFHLSRRGWGEFPIRVELFFKNSINKPINIVHNIKLDKTCSGRQTLGHETIVDLFLYGNAQNAQEETNLSQNLNPPSPASSKILNNSGVNTVAHSSTANGVSNTVETIPCNITNESLVAIPASVSCNSSNFRTASDIVDFDHCYFRTRCQSRNGEHEAANQIISDSTTELLDDINAHTNGWKSDKNDQNNVPENPLQNDEYVDVRMEILHKLRTVGQVLFFVFKCLPLCSSMALHPYYKRLYPFTCPSIEEWHSWNIGRRRSSEWSRARKIRNLLLTSGLSNVNQWHTKTILMFGRSHHFTPLASFGLFEQQSVHSYRDLQLIKSCYHINSEHTESSNAQHEQPLMANNVNGSILHTGVIHPYTDLEVNVDNDIEQSLPNNNLVNLSDLEYQPECMYIKQTALDNGIVLKPEIVDGGITINGAERMIFEAVKCLTENLVRRAINFKVCKSRCDVDTIERDDVDAAIDERTEFQLLKHLQQKRKTIEYFT